MMLTDYSSTHNAAQCLTNDLRRRLRLALLLRGTELPLAKYPELDPWRLRGPMSGCFAFVSSSCIENLDRCKADTPHFMQQTSSLVRTSLV